MMLPSLLSVVIFLPIIAGVLLLLFAEEDGVGIARGTAVAVGVVNFLLALPLLAGGSFETKLPWIPALGIHYFVRVDGLSLWLILLVALMTPIAAAASWNLIRARAKLYYGCMLLLSGGMIGVLASLDLFLFYVFWEVMLIPAFFLVGAFGGARRREATTKFVIYTMVGSLLMLVGIVYVATSHYMATGAWDFSLPALYGQHYAVTNAGAFFASPAHWAFAAFALAFAIKAALFPFHTWLPDAYGEAPAPVTFLLSGVMSKMGIYGFLRVAIPLFPAVSRDFTPLLIALSVTGIIYAALVALAQDDAKRTVAYASVSHLGVILLGVFAASTISVSGAVLLMVGHALTTGALFLLVGFLYERRGTTQIRAFGGLTKALPMFGALFMLVMLGSVGLPGLASFVGEFLVFLGAFGAHRTAAIFATTAIILGACYMLWMFQRTMFGPLTHPENRALPDLTMREGLLLLPIAIMIIWIGVYPQMLLERINPAAAAYSTIAAPAQVSLNTLGGVR